jgi:hypothetical protein
MKNYIKKVSIFCIITLSSLNNFAQPGVDSPDSSLEITDVPINDYLIPMLFFGISLSFFLLNKRKTA